MMLKSIAPRVGLFGIWIGALLIDAGCVDHKCPRGYDQRGDTCYRIKDAGADGSLIEAPDDSGALEDATFPVVRPDANDSVQSGEAGPVEDAAGDGAPHDDGGVAPGSDGDAGTARADSATTEDAAGRPEDCRSMPCQNGGICAVDGDSYACVCADGYTGSHCELEICGDTPIRTREDVENHQLCTEVHGDLDIAAVGLTAIEAGDFPFLRRITGDLKIVGLHATDGTVENLQTVTLSKLEVVEGSILVISSVVNGAGSGPLSELHLPTLTTVGVSLQVTQSTLRVLDLPILSTVDAGVSFRDLRELCTLNLRKVTRVGEVKLTQVPRISSPLFEPLRSAAPGPTTEVEVGCCWPNTSDRVDCQSFVSGCAGCRMP